MAIQNNKILETEYTVEGRKHTLTEIREKLLKKHEKFTRLHSDQYYENLTETKFNKILLSLNELVPNKSLGKKDYIKKLQNSRNI